MFTEALVGNARTYTDIRYIDARAYTDSRLSGPITLGDIAVQSLAALNGFSVGTTIFKPEPSLGNSDNPAPLTINKTILPRPYEAVDLGAELYPFRNGYFYDVDLWGAYPSLRNWMDTVTSRLNL